MEQRFSLTPYGQQLVANNIRLAYMMAARLRRPPGVTQDEWASEMVHVLCHCCCMYNPNVGTALSTYVCRGMIMRACDLSKRMRRRQDAGFSEVPIDPNGFAVSSIPSRDVDPAIEAESADTVKYLTRRLKSTRHGAVVLAQVLAGQNNRQIGQSIGVSPERVRQLQFRSVREMRESEDVKMLGLSK